MKIAPGSRRESSAGPQTHIRRIWRTQCPQRSECAATARGASRQIRPVGRVTAARGTF